ncbi:unnamed protein product, partial [Mesorhabditis spiculigera]
MQQLLLAVALFATVSLARHHHHHHDEMLEELDELPVRISHPVKVELEKLNPRLAAAKKHLQPFLNDAGEVPEVTRCLVNYAEKDGMAVMLDKPVLKECRKSDDMNDGEWIPGCFYAKTGDSESYDCWVHQPISMMADCKKECDPKAVDGTDTSFCCCWGEQCTSPSNRESARLKQLMRYEIDA